MKERIGASGQSLGCSEVVSASCNVLRLRSVVYLTGLALLGMLGAPQMARADSFTYNFSVTPNPSAGNVANGNQPSNINASGVITVSNIDPATGTTSAAYTALGAYTVTGITGTFSDSLNGISGTISGLESAPWLTPNSFNPDGVTFSPPAKTTAGFSYDDLFWPGANSPAVCIDAQFYSGGNFDVYGMAFDVTDGANEYTVDLWSNGEGTDPNGNPLGGYQVNDSVSGSKTPFTPNEMSGLAYGVNVSASPTPEPSSLALLGTGLSGMAALWRRRKMRV